MHLFFRLFFASALLLALFFVGGSSAVYAAPSCKSGVSMSGFSGSEDYDACKWQCDNKGFNDAQYYWSSLGDPDNGFCCCTQKKPVPEEKSGFTYSGVARHADACKAICGGSENYSFDASNHYCYCPRETVPEKDPNSLDCRVAQKLIAEGNSQNDVCRLFPQYRSCPACGSWGGGAATCDELITAKRAVDGTVTDDEMRDLCNGFSECSSHPRCVQMTKDMLCTEAQNAIAGGRDKYQICTNAEYVACPACAGWVPGDGGGGAFDELCTTVHEAIQQGVAKESACHGEYTRACPDCAGFLPPGVTEWQPGMGLGGAARSVSGKKAVDTGLKEALAAAKYKNPLSPGKIAGEVIKIILGIVGLFFLVMVVYAGVQWLTAAGDEKKIAESVRILWSSTIGILIVIAAYAFTVYLLNAITTASM